jgi:hypothetical protein
MRTKHTILRTLLAVTILVTGLQPTAAPAAVRLGMHMDFVLSNGTTVRVFPAAEDDARFGLRPTWKGSPEASKDERITPTSGNTCEVIRKELSAKVDKNFHPNGGNQQEIMQQLAANSATLRQRQMATTQKTLAASAYPAWIKAIPNLRSVVLAGNPNSLAKPSAWYYLPTEPRLSFRGQQPEATFIKFLTDEETAAGGAEGGLFHLLATFGLTQQEESELRGLLARAVPGAQLRGAVDLEPRGEGNNFIVTSATLSDQSFSSSGVITSGYAPTYPGGKAALAGRLTSIGAQLLETSFNNPTADLSVTFAYQYIAKTPAYRARIDIDLTRIREVSNCLAEQRTTNKETGWKFSGWKALFGIPAEQETTVVGVDQTKLEEAYDMLQNTGGIRILVEQDLPDADVSMIEGQLMETAMSAFLELQKSFTQPQMDMSSMPNQKNNNGDEEGQSDDRPTGENWRLYEVSSKMDHMDGHLTFTVDKAVAVYREHVMTGNMGAELRRYKDKVFSDVVLNDPFFKRGKISVMLDFDALDLFEARQINNAAVRVIVPFSGRAPYENNDLFTWQDVQNGKVTSEFTFATGGIQLNQDCLYSYVATWSLRGGGSWPPDPKPICKKDMKIDLAPPIVARKIEVEADLDEFDRAGIRGADVLLRYRQYGKTAVDDAVKFRVAQNEPYKETTLFVDKGNGSDARTPVEYAVVMVHKDMGNLPQSPWRPLEGDFVYVNLKGMPASYLEELKRKVTDIASVID